MEEIKKTMSITLEQQKLLSNSLRVQIIRLLNASPYTAKQVADQLGLTPGNVHYHIQRLVSSGLIQQVAVEENKGILEKYYRAVAERFELDTDAPFDSNAKPFKQFVTILNLNQNSLQEIYEDIESLLSKWETRYHTMSDPSSCETQIVLSLMKDSDDINKND